MHSLTPLRLCLHFAVMWTGRQQTASVVYRFVHPIPVNSNIETFQKLAPQLFIVFFRPKQITCVSANMPKTFTVSR